MTDVDGMLSHAPHKTVTRHGLAALVLVLSTSLNVYAETLTFAFGSGDDGLSTISKTLSGITLTLSNPNPRTTFKADSDGIAVGLEGTFLSGADLTSFQLEVTGGSLAFTGYTLGYTTGAESATFSMSGGTGSSVGNVLSAAGIYTAAGNWVLAPGDTGILTATGFDPGVDGLAQFASMSFEVVPVPEPSTFALGAAGIASAAWGLYRRRTQA